MQDLVTNVHVDLEYCLLEEGVLARDARMPSIVLTRCQIRHPSVSPLDRIRLACGVLSLEGSTIIGHAGTGTVNLISAPISGDLEFDGTHRRNDSGLALWANGLHVDQSMHLRNRFTAIGDGKGGAIRLADARIGDSHDSALKREQPR